MTRFLLILLFPLCLLGQTRAVINTGTNPNDGTGDTLRTFGLKSNTNFATLWAQVFTNGSYSFATNAFSVSGTNVSLSTTLYSPLTISGSFAVTSAPTARITGTNVWLEGKSSVRIFTPSLYAGTAVDGQVLTLTDDANGTVEFTTLSTADATKLPLAGGTMTGDIGLGLRWVTNSALAIRSTDLANRTYVDNEIASGATMTQPLATPIATLTSGLSIADPNGTNPPIWLDYQILASLTGTDTNAPTGVGTPSVWYDVSLMSGASISSLTDWSGNGRHATNATGAQQPTIVTNGLASKNTLRFTRASAQVLATPTFTVLPQPNTIFIVAKFQNTTSQNEVILDGGTQNNRIYAANAGLSGKISRISAATTVYDGHFTDTSWHVYEAYFNGDNTEFAQDGGTKYTMRTTSTSGGLDQVWLGGIVNNAGGFNFDGEVAEVLIYDKALSRAERNRVRQYLGRKWVLPSVQYVDAGIVTGVFRYASSIDSAPNNLLAAFAYPVGRANLPIVVHMHGFAGSVGTMMARNWIRQAQQGAFVVVPSLRSADGTAGTPDWSGREIHDIWDAVNIVRTNYATVVHTNLVAIAGYSGGGGNAMNYATKFPDSAAVIANHFGISDYGFNTTYGWYQASASVGQKSSMDTYLGTPGAAPDNYRTRSSVEAMPINYTGGWTYFFHDAADASVSINQTLAMVTNLVANGRSNFTTNYTDSPTPSAQRYLHQNPNDGSGAAASESIWLTALTSGVHNPWIVPESGTMRVNGYLVTKRFKVWLGGGTNEVATLAYNTTTRSYTVTPVTAPLDFIITQGSGSVTNTGVSTATTVTVP
jgi:poly(3-hydroxybutyrate) depolymerase